MSDLTVPLTDYVDLNPPPPRGLSPETVISLLPMEDATEDGRWVGSRTTTARQIGGGLTPFQDNDTLIAKITPCFENGKGAFVSGLANGRGIGSTEFHVLRPKSSVSPRLVHHFARMPHLRQFGLAFMSGSAGQQRVAAECFHRYRVPKFEVDEQRRIAAILDASEATIRATEAVIEKLHKTTRGVIANALHVRATAPPSGWSLRAVSDLAQNLDSRRIPVKSSDRQGMKGIYPYYGASGVIDYVDAFLFDGDYILVGEDGENIESRNVPLAFKACGKFWVNNHAHILQPQSGLSIDLLTEVLESQDYKSVVAGSAQPKLTSKSLMNRRVMWPDSEDGQARAISAITAIKDAAKREMEVVAKLRLQHQGLLHDLLTGTVRVSGSAA